MVKASAVFKGHRMKRPNRDLSFRRRSGYGHNLTSNEQVQLDNLWNLIITLIVRLRRKPDDKRMKLLLKCTISTYLTNLYAEDTKLSKLSDRKRTIESFGSAIKILFRFESKDLRIILKECRFPLLVRFDNNSKMTGEEVLLRGLFELVTGGTKHIIALEFGREQSIQSRAFKWFINHIFSNYKHLVQDNLQWWYKNGFWERSANAIGVKMQDRYPFQVNR